MKTINYKTKQIPIFYEETQKIDLSKINLTKISRETKKYTIIYIVYLFVYFIIFT